MRTRVIGLVGAFALALLGTTLLVSYVQGAEARALAGERTVDVLVVAAPIARGTKGEELGDLVRTEKVPAKVRVEGAVVDVASLKGRVAVVDLLPGEQLVDARFAAPQVAARANVPKGMLEVTVELERQRALGGRIAAGDSVGVLASFSGGGEGAAAGETTHLILHKVPVTHVQGGRTDADNEDAAAAGDTVMVTLALPAPSVERVVFAAEHGTLWLSAEPDDAAETGTAVQSRKTVLA